MKLSQYMGSTFFGGTKETPLSPKSNFDSIDQIDSLKTILDNLAAREKKINSEVSTTDAVQAKLDRTKRDAINTLLLSIRTKIQKYNEEKNPNLREFLSDLSLTINKVIQDKGHEFSIKRNTYKENTSKAVGLTVMGGGFLYSLAQLSFAGGLGACMASNNINRGIQNLTGLNNPKTTTEQLIDQLKEEVTKLLILSMGIENR